MKVAIITDTHWGARGNNIPMMDRFAQFYDDIFYPKIDELGVDTILHLGDLMHNRSNVNYLVAQQMVDSFLVPAKKRGMSVHVIAGNHDVFYRNTNRVNSLERLVGNNFEDVHIHFNEPVELKLDGCKIMLVPWLSKDNYSASMARMQSTSAQILMGHFEINGFEMTKGYLCDHGLDAKLFHRFDSVYSGHFHHPSSGANITYLGAPYEMDWGDYGGRRGFHIFDTDTRKMEFIANPYKMFNIIQYSDEDMSMEDVANFDVTSLKNSFVKLVVVNKTTPAILDALIDSIEGVGPAQFRLVEDPSVMGGSVISTGDEAENFSSIGKAIDDYIKAAKTTNIDRNMLDTKVKELYNRALNI